MSRMSASRIPRLVRRVVDQLASPALLRGRLLLVGDGEGWIIDDVTRNLSVGLTPELRPAIVTSQWRYARDCTIHFISRIWAWSQDALDSVPRSNRLIGLWWHGRLDSTNASVRDSLERTRSLHPLFTRMQVTCTSGRETMLALGVPEEKIVLLPMGVDLRRFCPPAAPRVRAEIRERLGLPPDRMVIGCFQKDGDGWETEAEPKLIKGPDVFADALARLNQQYPIHALIPGPARGYLRRRLSEAGVPFSAPGFVPAEALPYYYHALDIYVSPSRDEGGPAGVLESMASGVPVVSTRTGMPADMIQNGTNGFLVDIEDVDGITACTAELIRQRELRTAMAESALRTIQAYDWPVLSQRYAEELYRPVLPMARA